MSYHGIYSPTLGWYIFGPLSVFLFEPTAVLYSGHRLAGPYGPYEWWYLSDTPDLTGIFAYCREFGLTSGPPMDQYVGSYVRFGFRTVRDVFTDSPYLVVYTPLSSYLAALQLPFAFGMMGVADIYILIYFQNTPLN